jgi:hypothetical protein
MKRKKYLTGRDKIVDFVIGFIGVFVLNAAIYLSLNGIFFLVDIVGYGQAGAGDLIHQVGTYAMLVLPCAINFGLLLFFTWWRPWIALGALSALGSMIVLAILAGVCLVVGCLTIIGIAALREMMGIQP